jgi:hypothetical protein
MAPCTKALLLDHHLNLGCGCETATPARRASLSPHTSQNPVRAAAAFHPPVLAVLLAVAPPRGRKGLSKSLEKTKHVRQRKLAVFRFEGVA